jgi:hypothetical protein
MKQNNITFSSTQPTCGWFWPAGREARRIVNNPGMVPGFEIWGLLREWEYDNK